MAGELTGSVGVTVNAKLVKTTGSVLATAPLSIARKLAFTSGTTTGKADLIFSAAGSAAGAPVTIDLSNSASLDPLGGPVVMLRAKAIVIQNLSDTDGHFLLLDGTASNACLAWFNAISTAKLLIPAGGFVVLSGFLATAYAVTAGTGDLIVLDPGANTIPYAIDVIGCSV